MKLQDLPLNLKIFPDEVLRQICEPVEKFDSELLDLINEMFLLMRVKEGIGLAAPQVGITKRLFVCKIGDDSLILINPTIINVSGQEEMVEGCLSLPGVQVNVTRSDRLAIGGFNNRGRKIRYDLNGLWARVVQHEFDHLEGVLICDYGENLYYEKQEDEEKHGCNL